MASETDNTLSSATFGLWHARLSSTSRLAFGIMLATVLLVAVVWTTDPKTPAGFLGGLLQPLLYLLLTPIPLVWIFYCIENPNVGHEAKILVFAAIVPLNCYLLAGMVTFLRRRLVR